MGTQRRLADDSAGCAVRTRRGFLAASVAAGAVGLAGCATSLGRRSEDRPVSILAAGSLQRTLDEGLRDAVDVPIRVETHGSVTAARLVAEGKRDPDLLALADPSLFADVLDAPWHAEVATNALAIALADSSGGRRVADADRWFDSVLDGAAALGRTDPDLDPLGYRTLFAVELAADYYDEPDLRERLLASDQRFPETSLLSRVETGDVDAAVAYRTMAVERGVDYLDLPDAIDLSDPARDDRYGTASYELPDGTTVRGDHASYAVRARRTDERVLAVYDALTEGTVLRERGFEVPEAFPRYSGEVPAAIRKRT